MNTNSERSLKREFIQRLQPSVQLLSPHEISQRVRLDIGCVSICSLDEYLPVDDIRGYMVKFADKPNRSAEDPELYDCIISLQQSMAWQQVVWIKEILQIYDDVAHRTDSRVKLGEMLDSRITAVPSTNNTPSNVKADKNGFVLALGTAVPQGYRNILKEQDFINRYPLEELEKLLMVPEEKITHLLNDTFEDEFAHALSEC